MGGVASQPAIPIPAGTTAAFNVNRLASLAARYDQLKRDFSELYDEGEGYTNTLRDQTTQFRQQLASFQKDFETKLAEQQKRNSDLNARERNIAARNSALRQKIGEIEARKASNATSAANARAAALSVASEAAAAEKLRLEKLYSQELANLEAPLKAAREEFTRLSEQLKDLEAKTVEKPALNAAISTARSERNSLNATLQAAKSKVAEQIKQEESKLTTRLAELEATLGKEVEASRAAKLEALELELAGIRSGEEEKTKALLAEAEAKAKEEIARAAQEIASLRATEEAERTSRLATETAEVERQRAAAAKERADTEAAIRSLEAKAATNAASATKLAEERAELDRIKAEQASFESEKARILAEQTASREAAATAKQEAAAAKAEAELALREKQTADQERIKAEKIEKYRRHVYQIIKDWIGPLKTSAGIETFHDDSKDNYFFQKGNVIHDWVQQKTIDSLRNKYPYLKWQPRPDFTSFIGGRRRSTRRKVSKARRSRKH